MRLLNMHDLRGLRRTILAGKRCVGRGTFASVYAGKEPAASTVIKVTVDGMAYTCQADPLWRMARAHVDDHFPRLVRDYGDVGESRGAMVYALELERLVPVSPENRKLVLAWANAWDKKPPVSCKGVSTQSMQFCLELAGDQGPYREVFSTLACFFRHHGGALDLKPSNFMERPATGDLVFNDVVFDAVRVRTYNGSF